MRAASTNVVTREPRKVFISGFMMLHGKIFTRRSEKRVSFSPVGKDTLDKCVFVCLMRGQDGHRRGPEKGRRYAFSPCWYLRTHIWSFLPILLCYSDISEGPAGVVTLVTVYMRLWVVNTDLWTFDLGLLKALFNPSVYLFCNEENNNCFWPCSYLIERQLGIDHIQCFASISAVKWSRVLFIASSYVPLDLKVSLSSEARECRRQACDVTGSRQPGQVADRRWEPSIWGEAGFCVVSALSEQTSGMYCSEASLCTSPLLSF